MRQPTVFGKYLLLERISVGGMAEVFKAKSFGADGFEKIIAIKRILPAMVEDEEFIDMFIDEAKICSHLSHPNIGQVYELGKINDSYFIAMEFVWGKDVLQIQNRFRRIRQKMPIPMVAYLGAKICEALDYAHRITDERHNPLHIVHRDVSPQNVLVSYSGEVKLIDFGIAKARSRSSSTQAGVLKGKFGYMSPEQVRALPLDQRSDIFAIGTILYEMATGDRLFAAESDFATLEKVRNALVYPPSKKDPRIPPALEAIIMKALKKDPDERYSWASDLQDDLIAFLNTQKPLFHAKNLAAVVSKLFELEYQREEIAHREYQRIQKEDLYHFSALNILPPKPEAPIPLFPKEISFSDSDKSDEEELSEEDLAETQLNLPSSSMISVDAENDNDANAGATQISPPSFETMWPKGIPKLPSNEFGQSSFPAPTPNAAQTDGGMGVEISSTEPLTAEPTFIFNTELGQLMQLSDQATVIFASEGGNGEAASSQRLEGKLEIGSRVESWNGKIQTEEGPYPTSGSRKISELFAGRRGRVLIKDILIGVTLALIVILGLVLWKNFRTKPDRSNQLATLVITTIPSRSAEIFIDGISSGMVRPGMPFTQRNIQPQVYRIMVKSRGLNPVEQVVVLHPGDVRILKVPLPRGNGLEQAPKGILHLNVQPTGAKVFIDDREISADSLQAPLYLASGQTHEIRINKEGYTEYITKVLLNPGERRQQTIGLTPLGKSPSRNTKNTKNTERTAPIKKEEKTVPLKQVSPEKSKVKDHQASAASDRQGSSTSTEDANKIKNNATSPQSEGRDHNQKSAATSFKAKATDKPKSAEEKHATEESGKAAVASNGFATRRGTDMGYLVASTIPWAKVFVDGKDTGRTTPIAPSSKIPLKPGRHKVTFEVDGKKHSFTVIIISGQVTRVIKTLEME